MIFHAYKTIYFHVSKTAGVSIEHAFMPDSGDVTKPNYDIFYGYDPHENFYLQHASPAFMKSKVSASLFEDYFKFATVRNPFARLVSIYRYQIDQHSKKYGSFENFVLDLKSMLDGPSDEKGSHYSRQFSFCHIGSEPVCDLVIHFEDLPASFELVKQATGLIANLERRNVNSWAPPSDEPHTYFSSKSAEMVRTLYEQDFETLGYSYDPRIVHPVKQINPESVLKS